MVNEFAYQTVEMTAVHYSAKKSSPVGPLLLKSSITIYHPHLP